jgi:N-acetylglucosaminyl-diphospho-decaprenol L-rhamnosyltransferase|tara:strand:+ start:52 stop:936 length:885 start_codon:yes stop_codon:yes gene_type:complete
MSLSRQNLSIVIVTYKSEAVVYDCINSIGNDVEIIVVENSNNTNFKEKLEKNHSNVSCILSLKNLGMGTGNNVGIKKVKKDFVLILNPDVILEENTIDELISASKKIFNYAILAPISSDVEYPNYKVLNLKNKIVTLKEPQKVRSVDGFAMLLDKKKLDKLLSSEYFDENFFMYLENDDLCKRIIEANENIYIVPTSIVKHLGGKAVDKKYNNEVEFSRNWHWIWSKFYYQEKHFGYFSAFLNGFPKFISSLIKYFFYSIVRKKFKQKVYLNRASGFFNAAKKKPSWYRPRISD